MLSQPLASRGSRLAASILDTLVFIALLFFFGFGAGLSEANSETLGTVTILGALLATLGFAIYQIHLLVTQGQTLGKKIMKIRIVQYDDGTIPSAGRLLGMRCILNGILGNIPFYALIDVLFIFGAEQRCIHDLLAGTKVVEA